jgi:hypothetical protein
MQFKIGDLHARGGRSPGPTAGVASSVHTGKFQRDDSRPDTTSATAMRAETSSSPQLHIDGPRE